MTMGEIREMTNDDLILQLARIAQLDHYRNRDKVCAAWISAELFNRGVVSGEFVKSCADCLEL